MSVRVGRFVERSGVFTITQFAYRKGLGTCDALLCVSYTRQSALESGQEARIVQIDFSEAFDTVNYRGILYKLLVFGVLYRLYWHSSYLIDHSTCWWIAVGVRWSTWCQDCSRAVFWSRYCSSCKPQSFFLLWRINCSAIPMTLDRLCRCKLLICYADDYFGGCCAIPRLESCSGRVPKPLPQQS